MPLRVSCPGPLLRLACLGGGRPVPVPHYLAWGSGLPAHWAGCWGPSPTCCGRGRVSVGAHHCFLGLHALWRLRAAGVTGGRRRGGGVPPLQGASGVRRCPSPCRPSSGSGRRGPAIRVSRVRSVRAWGPSTGPTACALGGRRCSLWGGRRGVPGGAAFHRCEGRLRSAAPPPPTARPLGGLLGSATRVLWARACGFGGPTLSPWPARPVGAACRGGGRGLSRGGGWAVTVVRGVWCQPLSLPRPPVLWGGQPGYRDPCVPGAVGAGVGPSTSPTACTPAGRRCSLWGWRKGIPGRGAFHRCEGRLWSGAPPPRTTRPLGGLLGSATHMLWARACGCGGPTLFPQPACPVGAACRGGGGGPSPGGWPATVVRGVWCQALPPPRPPVLWGGQLGFRDPCVPAAVGAGLGTQHRPHSVRPCGPALLAVGVAEGPPREGCLPPL